MHSQEPRQYYFPALASKNNYLTRIPGLAPSSGLRR